MLEYIGATLFFLFGESIIDALISKNYTALYLIAPKEKLLGLKELFRDRRFYMKIVKFILIPVALWYYSRVALNYDFAKIYVVGRILLFDAFLSLGRFDGFKPFMWYLENHITVRTVQFIKRRFF